MLAFGLVFAVSRCTENELKAAYSENNEAALRQELTHTISKTGDTIYSQRQIIVQSKQRMKDYAYQIADYKQIQSQTQAKTVTTVKTVYIPIDRAIYIRDTSGTYLKLPATFKSETRWYAVDGTILDSSVVKINSMSFFNEPVVTLSLKKKAVKELFKKDEYIVSYVDKNPYSRTTQLVNVSLAQKAPKRFGIGVQAGYGFQQGIMPRPYVGIGLSYNFIRF